MSDIDQVRPLILLVDDHEVLRSVTARGLEAGGFEVVGKPDGASALAELERIRPDVILLDVCLPDMSGVDVCRAIKRRQATSQIPIIFISGVVDRDSIMNGFAAGVVDFLAKPFNSDELRVRVAVHAQLNRARRQLEESHARLAELNHEKDLLLGMMAHDLRGPLSVIVGFSDYALQRIEAGEQRAERHPLEVIRNEAEHMSHFLGMLLDLNALERAQVPMRIGNEDLAAAARAALTRITPMAMAKNITLNLIVHDTRLLVRADRTGLRRLLDNYLSNAIKFTPPGGRATVRVECAGTEAELYVCDSGPGMSEADLRLAFGRFERLSARPTAGEKSTGLGLAICRALAVGMGARTWCGNNIDGGAFFAVSFRLATPASPSDSGDNPQVATLPNSDPQRSAQTIPMHWEAGISPQP